MSLVDFFEDIFDRPITDPDEFKAYVDTTTPAIRYDRLLMSNELRQRVAGCFLWHCLFKVFPSKLDITRLTCMMQVKWEHMSFEVILQKVMAYVQQQTVLKIVKISDPEAILKRVATEMQGSTFMQSWLVQKWLDRYSVIVTTADNASLFTVYKQIRQLAKREPSERSLDSRVAHNMISGSFNRPLYAAYMSFKGQLDHVLSSSTDLECMRHIFAHDISFIRAIVSCDVVWFAKEVSSELISVVCDGLNDAAGSQQITVLFEETEPSSSSIKPFYYKSFKGISRNVLCQIPRLARRFYAVICCLKDAPQPLGRERVQNRCVLAFPPSETDYTRVHDEHYDHTLAFYDASSNMHEAFFSACQSLHLYAIPLPIYELDKGGSMTVLDILQSKAFVLYVLRISSQLSCPFRITASNSVQDIAANYLYVLHAIQRYANKHQIRLREISIGASNEAATSCIVLVDTRPSIMSVLCAYLTFANLDPAKWGIRVVTPVNQIEFYAKYFSRDSVVTHPDLRCEKFTVEDYTNLLKEASFWKLLHPFKKCLTVQDDAVILRPDAQDKIDSTFAHYDYVGAPWLRSAPVNYPLLTDANPELVGNGGLSYRSIDAMIAICEQNQHSKHDIFHTGVQTLPEDVFFSHHIYHHREYTLCPESIARDFSSEQVLHRDSVTGHPSLGIHKPWMYSSIADVKNYLDSY